MALDKTDMAGKIADNIIIVNPRAVKADLMIYWEPICQGIIDHFEANAEVLPGTFIDGMSQPVTGKGEIT